MYAYAALAPQAAHAATAAIPRECLPVYDTTLGETGEDSAALTAQIARYADEDVDVRVQILKHPGEAGIPTDNADKSHEAEERYSKSLINRCDWDDDNIAVIVLAVDPSGEHGHYNVYRGEGARDNLGVDEIKTAGGAFKTALADTNSPFQTDIARFMGDIDPAANDETDTLKTVLVAGVIGLAAVGVFVWADKGGKGGRGGGYYGGSSTDSWTYTGGYDGGSSDSGSVGDSW